MIKKSIRRLLFAGAAASLTLVSIGCESITNNVETAELAGFWVASKMRFANPANLNETVDAIAALGYGLTLEIEADGSYTRVLIPPDEAPDTALGTLNVENGKDITMTSTIGSVAVGEVFLEDDQVALMFDENQGLTADINGSGNEVPVTLLAVMDRQ